MHTIVAEQLHGAGAHRQRQGAQEHKRRGTGDHGRGAHALHAAQQETQRSQQGSGVLLDVDDAVSRHVVTAVLYGVVRCVT